MVKMTIDQDKEYLELERLEVKSSLTSLLPHDIARRYHALPISKEGDKITVVIADPNDSEARNAILDSLGSPTYFVKADIQTIDHSLDMLWPVQSSTSPLIHVWTPIDSTRDETNAYARDLASLLVFRVSQSRCYGEGKTDYNELAEEIDLLNPHLMIVGIPTDLSEKKLVERFPVSQLFARNPRLPLKKLLLVINNVEADDAAIDWALLMARRSGAALTILPILPPIPLMYSGLNQMRHNLPTLLTTNCPLGRKMRQIVKRLNEWEINGTLRLRDEAPDWQIRVEVLEGDYDLTITACEPCNHLFDFMRGGFVNSILDCAEQPVLVAKNPPA